MSYRPYRSYNSPPPPVLPIFLSFLAINLAISSILGASADRRHTQEIQQELVQRDGVHGVENLQLHDGWSEDTFTFRTQDGGGKPENCTGTYEVRDRVAHIVGDLSCELAAN